MYRHRLTRLSYLQWWILAFAGKGWKAPDLPRGYSRQAVHRSINRLVGRGLLEKRITEHRRVQIKTTADGTVAFRAVEAQKVLNRVYERETFPFLIDRYGEERTEQLCEAVGVEYYDTVVDPRDFDLLTNG